jgi:hypothetical protein
VLIQAILRHMADCKTCGRDIEDPGTTSCSKSSFAYDAGEYLTRTPYDDTETAPCSVCHVMPGGVHHDGCYMERYPRCTQRLISCGYVKG